MNTLLISILLFFVWPFSGAKEIRMQPSTSVPAATGMIKVERDKENGNNKLDIKVDHLANPSSLTPAQGAYLVWVQARGGDPVKQGAIGVDKNLKGELKIVTVSKDFDLFITAEQGAEATTPSGMKVLSAHVNLG